MHKETLTIWLLSCQNKFSFLNYGFRTEEGRMFDSRSRGCRFKPHQRHCIVSLSLFLFILCLVLVQSKEDDKYQISIQSSSIWDSDKVIRLQRSGIDTIKYHTWPRISMGKWQTHRRHHRREPRGQPFPSRWPQSTYKQTRTKHSKHKTEQKHKRSTKHNNKEITHKSQ